IIPITYKTVTGVTTPGPISVRVKEGSSRYWLAVLIDNHGNQLKSVTVNGKSTHREDYNYWVIDGGAGSGPFKIKISDVYGHSTVAAGIRLTPGATQKTSVRLTGDVEVPPGQDAVDLAAGRAILDIKMPRMDGMELLRRLRQKTDMPVIFLTSKDEEIDELFGLKMGA